MSLSRNPLNRRRFLCLLGLSAIAAPLLVTACTRAEAQLDDSFTPVEGEDQSDLLTIGLSLLGSLDPATGPGEGSGPRAQTAFSKNQRSAANKTDIPHAARFRQYAQRFPAIPNRRKENGTVHRRARRTPAGVRADCCPKGGAV